MSRKDVRRTQINRLRYLAVTIPLLEASATGSSAFRFENKNALSVRPLSSRRECLANYPFLDFFTTTVLCIPHMQREELIRSTQLDSYHQDALSVRPLFPGMGCQLNLVNFLLRFLTTPVLCIRHMQREEPMRSTQLDSYHQDALSVRPLFPGMGCQLNLVNFLPGFLQQRLCSVCTYLTFDQHPPRSSTYNCSVRPLYLFYGTSVLGKIWDFVGSSR
jgi:hypothetical protein